MTAGVAQARRLGMKRVACVSTGNTSASMAAYASAGGLEPLIFIPNGNISYGKLAQALEYGAKTFQVDANFDQILALVRVLTERLGIYLLNSINPFRIEGQKSIVIEMMDQRDWKVPDWIVLPGGNLGNVSAFGKGLRELHALGFIDTLPRLAVVQAAGASPFYEYMQAKRYDLPRRKSIPKPSPPPSRSAIPSAGPKRSSKSRLRTESSKASPNRKSPTPRPSSDTAASAANRLPPPRSPASANSHRGIIARCRRGRRPDRQRPQGSRLHLPLPHGSVAGARRFAYSVHLR